jgi:hypothetical protein
MNPPNNRESQDRLERLVHRTLRQLPARPAPRSLEQRVLAEIERREALPWWRKSFVHWPVPARAVFLVVCVAIAKLALMGSVWVMAGFDAAAFREAFAPQVAWMANAVAVFEAIRSCFEIVGRNIPPLILYGGAAFIAAMYALVFGLGAAAYKAIHARR